ncbi:carbamoyltransferase HypF [Desulfopila sp. IMCC35008]|uniref:carbamoyltransferase HypF n=1 Tax=Desulfopila sp. IMCC35008 TaxID=2653858 RepID=UPI0013D8BF02|nr:carbamoyltransferase HypF [Desulfopila sp. IMCC35008]
MKDPKGFEILIRGTVQGVGFRPFVYNLASRLEINGTVTNTSDGVVVHAHAPGDRLSAFVEALEAEAPPLSRIVSLEHHEISEPSDVSGFTILASKTGDTACTAIPPDIALCSDCLAEMLDPKDHRHHYPFINCTNCGPRFSIVESIPYDRPKTSMKVFPMCGVCDEQYHDPTDRRFHAQPNACGDCGPQLSFHDNKGQLLPTDSPLTETSKALAADKILAIRGLGGFHLTVNGYSHQVVQTLRQRKGRPDKPLAVMMANLEVVKQHCHISEEEKQLLQSTAQPIVLLHKKDTFSLADNLAPQIDELGVMLPYTPFHHLLFQQPGCPDALVMTSGNVSGAPICTANDDAIQRLGKIADNFLLHNRDIVTRIDDSVARVTNSRQQIYRRARGYVPAPVEIPWKLPQVIGCGGGLKSTFCLGRENSAFLSQHIGDLFNLESYDFYLESIEHLQNVFQIEPEIAVCDQHPDYLSSHYASELDIPLYRVQHHHAHAVTVMAEHGISGPVLGVIMDGTGYGPDKTIWGGEILLADLTSYKRLAHLQQLRLPGGDAAAAQPWRMGLSALYSAFDGPCPDELLPQSLDRIPLEKRKVIHTMLDNGFNTPLSSSCGRLFDAAASILGVRQDISYEGQAAIELESLARRSMTSTWHHQIEDFCGRSEPFQLGKEGGKIEICSAEFVKLLAAAVQTGTSPEEAAMMFHFMLIGNLVDVVRHLAESTGVRQVVLAGGCMQNSLLLEGLFHALPPHNIEVYTGETLPINDGGISLGQTITGGLQHVSRNSHEGYQG